MRGLNRKTTHVTIWSGKSGRFEKKEVWGMKNRWGK